MAKHFDYEDDHDWDDNVDYAAKEKKYWYGKYYPKEYIDALMGVTKDKDALDTSELNLNELFDMLKGAGFVISSFFAVYKNRKKIAELIKYRWDGYDKNGYDREGYNREGYDKEGYDRIGYSRQGYDKQGYDCYGYDKDGYDKEGRNSEGYNHAGFGKDGYNKKGYNRRGLDREGYDKSGYDANGYNREGMDISGYKKDYYYKKVAYIKEIVEKVNIENEHIVIMKYFRKIINIGLVLIIEHKMGQEKVADKMFENMKICGEKRLLNETMIKELHWFRVESNQVLYECY